MTDELNALLAEVVRQAMKDGVLVGGFVASDNPAEFAVFTNASERGERLGLLYHKAAELLDDFLVDKRRITEQTISLRPQA